MNVILTFVWLRGLYLSRFVRMKKRPHLFLLMLLIRLLWQRWCDVVWTLSTVWRRLFSWWQDQWVGWWRKLLRCHTLMFVRLSIGIQDVRCIDWRRTSFCLVTFNAALAVFTAIFCLVHVFDRQLVSTDSAAQFAYNTIIGMYYAFLQPFDAHCCHMGRVQL